MKNILISVGLAAAGTASFQVYAQDLTPMQTTKIWSASATLRGFYDDNYTTSSNGNKQGSAGYEVSPSVQLNVPLQQTEIGLKYTYGLYYYQERQNQGNDPYDQTHQVDLWLDHAFTERVQGTVKDTFAIGQEPSLLNTSGGANPVTYRVNGNNLANSADVSLTTDWTREFSTVTTYDNNIYDYQDDGTTEAGLLFGTQSPSLAGLLNRLDQSLGTDFRWMIEPETYVSLGYRFEWVIYTAGEPIGVPSVSHPSFFFSNDNNNRSHFLYLGFQHSFLPNLNFSAQAGVQDTSYYNNPQTSDFVTPYVNITSTYTYAPGSYLQVGFLHSQNASANSQEGSNGNINQGQQSSVFSASLNHRLTAKLMGSLIGTIQDSRYNQGLYNNNSDVTYSLGANLSYAFNQHFSAELGYNFDDLQSNIPQNGYSRNRVYLGVTATY
jgi:Putative beta-barrel porin 2